MASVFDYRDYGDSNRIDSLCRKALKNPSGKGNSSGLFFVLPTFMIEMGRGMVDGTEEQYATSFGGHFIGSRCLSCFG